MKSLKDRDNIPEFDTSFQDENTKEESSYSYSYYTYEHEYCESDTNSINESEDVFSDINITSEEYYLDFTYCDIDYDDNFSGYYNEYI